MASEQPATSAARRAWRWATTPNSPWRWKKWAIESLLLLALTALLVWSVPYVT